MEKSEQGTEGRFHGGIFSGREQEKKDGGNMAYPYQNFAGEEDIRRNPQEQQVYYKNPLLTRLEQKQGSPGNCGSGNCGSGKVPQGSGGNTTRREERSMPVSGYVPMERKGADGRFGASGRCSGGMSGAEGFRTGTDFHSIHENASGCYAFSNGRCPYGFREWPDRRQPRPVMFLLALMAAMGMLFVAFIMVIFLLVIVVLKQPAAPERAAAASPYTEWSYAEPEKQESPVTLPQEPGKQPETDGGSHGEYYGEIRDAVRTDLAYSIEWENYEFAGNGDTVMIAVDYPVLRGNVPNIELLNSIIASETDYFEEYYKEYSQYMQPEELFAVYSEGFVTYMDENVMSVVFNETIYTDYWVDCSLFCVNIDMENGIVLDNGSILDVDDEFAVDFRTRSREQNGDISALEYLTDQEVAYYLTNGSTGIIFFTPMGMEIGLNYGEDYLTVTYKDYKDFLLKY